MSEIMNDAGLNLIFRNARTHRAWTDQTISEVLLRALYDLLRLGPTTANSSPARFVFLKSKESKNRLAPALSADNLAQTMAAPVTVIVGYDTRFYENLPILFPGDAKARSWFDKDERHAETTAFRNGTLQGAYLIIAARALGLDCGPMSGFKNETVDREFFPEGRVKSNFLCNIGYANPKGLPARGPRLAFEDACEIL